MNDYQASSCYGNQYRVMGSRYRLSVRESSILDRELRHALQREPGRRCVQDLHRILIVLRGLRALAPLRDSALRSLCKVVSYEKHNANDILYCRGELCTCWYILLSGSVFIDGSMYLPGARTNIMLAFKGTSDASWKAEDQGSVWKRAQDMKVSSFLQEKSGFGKRTGVSVRRANECLILEPSEMIVVDYPDVQATRTAVISGQRTFPLSQGTGFGVGVGPNLGAFVHAHPHQYGGRMMDGDRELREREGGVTGPNTTVLIRNSGRDIHETDQYPISSRNSEVYVNVMHTHQHSHSHRSSHGSDTSSAYSGSDTIQSSLEAEAEEVDLSGLMETLVDDSDEEDLAESVDSLTVRDTVRDCLEKDPSERTDDDIEILLEFTQHLRAFSNMTLFVRRALCRVMVFAVVEKANTIVMQDEEELDSWSVIINGHVEVEIGNGEFQLLQLGDSFGITPTMEKLYQKGVMRTKVDDCQFVCITQTDYYKILHQGEENTRKHEEGGRVVLVTEQVAARGSNVRSHIVVKGTPEKLTGQLVEDSSSDPSYVDDFLLTHRIFIDSPLIVCNKLLEWFNDITLRDKVTRVVILWVNNHFTDFETDPLMMDFLEKFETKLEEVKMQELSHILSFACAAKARSRTVTLTRPSRDEVLSFSILGGYDRNSGIFIQKVEKGSKAEEVGLKRGDQVWEVNGQSFEHISHTKALEILRGSTHLSVTVKSNLLGLKNLLKNPDNSSRTRSNKKSTEMVRLPSDSLTRVERNISGPEVTPCGINSPNKEKRDNKGFMTLGPRSSKFIKVFGKIIHSKGGGDQGQDEVDSGPPKGSQPASQLFHSHSNPDLTSSCYDDPKADFPEHVLKVYKADQTFKYLLVHKETTAREVVMLALREFGITDPSSDYSLSEVTVAEGGFIKQKRLYDQLQNLAERIGVASRYYLKNNQSTEPLVPDDLAAELKRESQVHLLQLNAAEVAIQLTLEDFSIFRQIESTEYVDTIFSLKSRYGTPQLARFAELNNHELFWVVTEICSEPNLVRRTRIIKQFIKIARQCKECRNFNSMFAIISGLNHTASRRLKGTWEKIPAKYQRIFKDLQELMDPSRNFSKYRNLINNENAQPPIIPFFPIVNKDLTFIRDGNDTYVNGMINFEKMRMVAKEVRSLCHMCSAPYDLFTMMELGGHHPPNAMMILNQMGLAGGNYGGHIPGTGLQTGKRRKKSTVAPQPKKMFEEAQMVRRVKAYLVQIKVITDETELLHMSTELEPPPGSVSSSTMISHAGSVSSVGNESQGRSSHTGSMSVSNVLPFTSVQIRKRHPSPTLSTTSTASSTSATSEGRKSNQAGTKFGAASPQSMRKMLALSEPSKTRPYQPPRLGHGVPSHVPQLSPSPSPGLHRRGREGQPRTNHERSHSDTPSMPVDLSAESSSVTSLSNLPLRKNISGSISSSDGGSVSSFAHPLGLGLTLGIGLGLGLVSDDAGYCTQPDSHSNSSAEGAPMKSKAHCPPIMSASPPLHPRSAVYQPVLVGNSPPCTSKRPNLINGVQVLPMLMPGRIMAPPRDIPPKARRPPDYSVAAEMARQARLSRAYSHEGVTGYYHTDPEEDAFDPFGVHQAWSSYFPRLPGVTCNYRVPMAKSHHSKDQFYKAHQKQVKSLFYDDHIRDVQKACSVYCVRGSESGSRQRGLDRFSLISASIQY